MNINKIVSCGSPFKHWEITNCLNKDTIDEISYSTIPDGNRSYDGTRAADHTGKGVDGKLRLFIDKSNCEIYPNLTMVIKKLQQKEPRPLMATERVGDNKLCNETEAEVLDKTGFVFCRTDKTRFNFLE